MDTFSVRELNDKQLTQLHMIAVAEDWRQVQDMVETELVTRQ
jgi:hypothetical protein